MGQCRSVKSERHFFDGILGLGHTNLTRIPPVGSARRQHEAADVLPHGLELAFQRAGQRDGVHPEIVEIAYYQKQRRRK